MIFLLRLVFYFILSRSEGLVFSFVWFDLVWSASVSSTGYVRVQIQVLATIMVTDMMLATIKR